jgi:hypothetical protein
MCGYVIYCGDAWGILDLGVCGDFILCGIVSRKINIVL